MKEREKASEEGWVDRQKELKKKGGKIKVRKIWKEGRKAGKTDGQEEGKKEREKRKMMDALGKDDERKLALKEEKKAIGWKERKGEITGREERWI